MELLWENEPVSAKELSLLADERIGWNKNTTYTVIKKLISKGAVKREEPKFICSSLINREDVRKQETKSLLNKLFNGSKKALFSALIDDENLTKEDIDGMKRMLEEKDKC